MRIHALGRLSAFIAIALLIACSPARAGFLDDSADLQQALAELRAAIGERPRVLKIQIEPKAVAIEAQDPRNHLHIDQWRYEIRNYGLFARRPLKGPQPVEPQLIDPDLEANLFDLDAVDFSAASKLEREAIQYAHLEDPADVTRIEIVRQISILPSPKAGEVRWSLHVASGREHAEIYADRRGAITSSDLSGTQRAKSLNLLAEPEQVLSAARSFRAAVGAGPVLHKVEIDARRASFKTNIRDKVMGRLFTGLPSFALFTWNLEGLRQQLGTVDVSAQMGAEALEPFSVDDVDWSVLGKLKTDALAKAALPNARVAGFQLAKSADGPGAPALAWIVEIVDDDGERTQVIADLRGAIVRVRLPESRRPKTEWLNPAALASAIARIGATFGQNVAIASVTAKENAAQVTIDDLSRGGKPQTFDFSADGATRTAISFSADAMGPRLAVADLAPLTEQRIAAIEADAIRKLGAGKKVYLESVRIGPHMFVRNAGARAVEVRVRNSQEDSARASYAWIVYDFQGRALDMSPF